jgi:hypothetical protein
MSAALDNTNHEDAHAPPPMPPGARAPRRVAKLDHATLTITTPDENGASTYHVGALPEAARQWAMMQGVWTFMRMADDPDAAFARLQSGNIPRPRSGEKPPKKPNAWRLAYAHALVEETKKSENPLTIDAATETARKLSLPALKSAKVHPLVIKHFHRLNGSTAPSLASLT